MAEPSFLATCRQVVILDWAQLTPGTAVRLIPGPVLVLVVALMLHAPQAGAVAGSGAIVVGFGSFQQFTRSHAGSMLFAVFGMSVSAFIGTLAGQSDMTMALVTLVFAFWCGLLPGIGMGAFWVGQQCTIFLLIAGAYSGGTVPALERSALVLAGGAMQVACYAAAIFLARGRVGAPRIGAILADARTAMSGLLFQIRLRSPFFRFGLRVALVLVAAVVTERRLAIPNGYWVAMTALLLMRPDFQDALARSLGRIGGTIAGAVLASAIAHVLTPEPPVLAVLVAGFAFLAYATLRLNYGVFAFFVTGYVIFLLVMAGLVEPRVARWRVEATVIGGLFALAGQLDFYWRRRRRAQPT